MRKIQRRGKKALSPVIATVLLIALTVVITLVVFLWIRGFTKEAITKNEQNVELVCKDVSLTAEYREGENTIYINNNGNIPIFGMKLKIETAGSRETLDISDVLSNSNDWPSIGLKKEGSILAGVKSNSFTDVEKITAIPVLLGKSNSGDKTYVCDEADGMEVAIV